MLQHVLQVLAYECHRNMWEIMADITFTMERHILLKNIWKTLCVKELEMGNRDHAENLGISQVQSVLQCQQDVDMV